MSSIPGNVGYILFIEPTITKVPSGFSGYIWLDTKIVLNKKLLKFFFQPFLNIRIDILFFPLLHSSGVMNVDKGRRERNSWLDGHEDRPTSI